MTCVPRPRWAPKLRLFVSLSRRRRRLVSKAWRRLGRACSEAGLWERAVAAYDQSLVLEPSRAESWRRLGRACSEAGLWERAVAAYDQSMVMEPSRSLLAELSLKLGVGSMPYSAELAHSINSPEIRIIFVLSTVKNKPLLQELGETDLRQFEKKGLLSEHLRTIGFDSARRLQDREFALFLLRMSADARCTHWQPKARFLLWLDAALLPSWAHGARVEIYGQAQHLLATNHSVALHSKSRSDLRLYAALAISLTKDSQVLPMLTRQVFLPLYFRLSALAAGRPIVDSEHHWSQSNRTLNQKTLGPRPSGYTNHNLGSRWPETLDEQSLLHEIIESALNLAVKVDNKNDLDEVATALFRIFRDLALTTNRQAAIGLTLVTALRSHNIDVQELNSPVRKAAVHGSSAPNADLQRPAEIDLADAARALLQRRMQTFLDLILREKNTRRMLCRSKEPRDTAMMLRGRRVAIFGPVGNLEDQFVVMKRSGFEPQIVIGLNAVYPRLNSLDSISRVVAFSAEMTTVMDSLGTLSSAISSADQILCRSWPCEVELSETSKIDRMTLNAKPPFSPYLLQLVLLYLIENDAGQIYFSGSNFFAGTRARAGYMTRASDFKSWYDRFGMRSHDLLENFEFVRCLWSNGLVTPSPEAQRILALNDLEYLMKVFDS